MGKSRRLNNLVGTTASYIRRDDTISNYLDEIRKIPTMTAEDERKLLNEYQVILKNIESIKLIHDLSDTDKKSLINKENVKLSKIKNEIVMRNQRFVFAMAKRYNNSNIVMDLVNVGTIGMFEAFDNYDFSRNYRFCTFAGWYIRRAMNAYINKENLIVRPTNGTVFTPKVKKIENDFFLENGRYPSPSELDSILSAKFGLKVKNTNELYGAKVNSISDPINDDGDSDFETSPDFVNHSSSHNDYEDTIEDDAVKYLVQNAMSRLDDREKTIVSMSVGYGYDKEFKDKEIGEVIGLTSERVRQIKHNAIKKMASAIQVATAY